jgi:hypothetical protein
VLTTPAAQAATPDAGESARTQVQAKPRRLGTTLETVQVTAPIPKKSDSAT